MFSVEIRLHFFFKSWSSIILEERIDSEEEKNNKIAAEKKRLEGNMSTLEHT